MDAEVLALLVRAKDDASAEFKKIEHSLHTLIGKAHVAERSFGALHSVLAGIGAGIGISIFQSLESVIGRLTALIPSLIEKGISFADTIENLQLATGATAEATSRFVGQLTFLGIPVEMVTAKIGMMTKGIIAHEGELNKLGVSIRDSSGRFLDQVTIMDRARGALSGMQDGVAKTKVAMDLFGRTGAGMIEWLNLTDKQVGLLNVRLDALGVTMSQAMVDNAKAAADEGHLLDLAMQGLANTLTANVAPALTVAIDSIVNFVQQNGQAIAAFASQVVNFVLGMIAALTGATVQTVSFTGEINAARGATAGFSSALDNAAGKQNKAAGGAKAHTAALDGQIARTTKAIDAIKALDTAQDASFTKQMGHLSAQLGAQLSLLDASEKAHALAETQAAQAQQMSDAQRSLADALAGTTDSQGVTTVDPRAVESAQRSITAITQQQADLQTSIVNDARRAQIKDVQNYIDAMTKAETSWTDKKGLLAQLQKNQASLASASEAAAKAGDLQKVADLAIEMEAVQTAITRTEQAKRNGDRTADLTKHKAQLEDLKKAAAGAATGPGGIGPVFTKGAGDAGVAIKKLGWDTNSEMHGIREAVAGQKSSVASAMETARLAGMKFGTDMRNSLVNDVIPALQSVAGWLGTIADIISRIDPKNIIPKLESMAPPTNSGAGGSFNVMDFLFKGFPGYDGTSFSGNGVKPHAAGGWVGLKGPEVGMLGERGPEYIVPNGGGTGGTVNINAGAIVVQGNQDPAATAAAVMLSLKRELTRQNTSLSGGY